MTIVRFAARAADYSGCVELKLVGNPENVAAFSGCLRDVADAYRQGLTSALTQQMGIDTYYVAAMRQAAAHLPLQRPQVLADRRLGPADHPGGAADRARPGHLPEDQQPPRVHKQSL